MKNNMNRINQLLNLFMLIVIPIIGNFIYLIIFPFFIAASIFADNEEFQSGIEKLYKAIAKFDR